MTATPARRTLPALAALALLACAPPAAAEAGEVLSGSARYDAPAVHEGGLSMLFLLDSAQSGDTRPWVDLRAAAIEGVQYTRTYAGVRAPTDPPLEASSFLPEEGNESFAFQQARATLAAAQPEYQVHVYTMDGTMDARLESAGGLLESRDQARMGRGDFGPAATGSSPPPGQRPSNADFALVERPGPWVVHRETAARASLVVRGDLVVELHGLTLRVEDASQQRTVESGDWYSPVQGAPPATSSVAFERQTRFVRLFLTDAVLELASDGGSPRLEWAAASLASTASGPVTLYGATGRLDGGPALDGGRHVVPAGSRLDIAPRPEQLSIRIAPAGLGPRGSAVDVAAPASAALVGAGAVLALAAAVGVGLLRHTLRPPGMTDVETALEEGRYRRAARLASRILARRPADESAVLGRAIALTKGGRTALAARELDDHLRSTPASDGSLHYVLGLAQIELGRVDEGRASLREAVRLTPSLHAQVAPRLGRPSSVLPTHAKETHGYA